MHQVATGCGGRCGAEPHHARARARDEAAGVLAVFGLHRRLALLQQTATALAALALAAALATALTAALAALAAAATRFAVRAQLA